MKNRILTPQNAQQIINAACPTWRTILAKEWATNIVLRQNNEIDEEFYKEMRSACTASQHELFDSIFGKDKRLISTSDLAIGEAMMIVDPNSRWDSAIISRIWNEKGKDATFVNMKDPKYTWTPSPKFNGIRVKLTITHEEVK